MAPARSAAAATARAQTKGTEAAPAAKPAKGAKVAAAPAPAAMDSEAIMEETEGQYPRIVYHKDFGKEGNQLHRTVVDEADEAKWAKRGYGEHPETNREE